MSKRYWCPMPPDPYGGHSEKKAKIDYTVGPHIQDGHCHPGYFNIYGYQHGPYLPGIQHCAPTEVPLTQLPAPHHVPLAAPHHVTSSQYHMNCYQNNSLQQHLGVVQEFSSTGHPQNFAYNYLNDARRMKHYSEFTYPPPLMTHATNKLQSSTLIPICLTSNTSYNENEKFSSTKILQVIKKVEEKAQITPLLVKNDSEIFKAGCDRIENKKSEKKKITNKTLAEKILPAVLKHIPCENTLPSKDQNKPNSNQIETAQDVKDILNKEIIDVNKNPEVVNCVIEDVLNNKQDSIDLDKELVDGIKNSDDEKSVPLAACRKKEISKVADGNKMSTKTEDETVNDLIKDVKDSPQQNETENKIPESSLCLQSPQKNSQSWASGFLESIGQNETLRLKFNKLSCQQKDIIETTKTDLRDLKRYRGCSDTITTSSLNKMSPNKKEVIKSGKNTFKMNLIQKNALDTKVNAITSNLSADSNINDNMKVLNHPSTQELRLPYTPMRGGESCQATRFSCCNTDESFKPVYDVQFHCCGSCNDPFYKNQCLESPYTECLDYHNLECRNPNNFRRSESTESNTLCEEVQRFIEKCKLKCKASKYYSERNQRTVFEKEQRKINNKTDVLMDFKRMPINDENILNDDNKSEYLAPRKTRKTYSSTGKYPKISIENSKNKSSTKTKKLTSVPKPIEFEKEHRTLNNITDGAMISEIMPINCNKILNDNSKSEYLASTKARKADSDTSKYPKNCVQSNKNESSPKTRKRTSIKIVKRCEIHEKSNNCKKSKRVEESELKAKAIKRREPENKAKQPRSPTKGSRENKGKYKGVKRSKNVIKKDVEKALEKLTRIKDKVKSYAKQISSLNKNLPKETPSSSLKSVVQIPNISAKDSHCHLVTKRDFSPEYNIDLRNKLNQITDKCSNPLNIQSILNPESICENLVINLRNNEYQNKTDNFPVSKSITKSENGEEIHVVINLVYKKPQKQDEPNTQVLRNKEDANDFSFLDDIDVDEIAECLKTSKDNAKETTLNIPSCSALPIVRQINSIETETADMLLSKFNSLLSDSNVFGDKDWESTGIVNIDENLQEGRKTEEIECDVESISSTDSVTSIATVILDQVITIDSDSLENTPMNSKKTITNDLEISNSIQHAKIINTSPKNNDEACYENNNSQDYNSLSNIFAKKPKQNTDSYEVLCQNFDSSNVSQIKQENSPAIKMELLSTEAAVDTIVKREPVIIIDKLCDVTQHKEYISPAIKMETEATIVKLEPVIIKKQVSNVSENKESSSPAIKIESLSNEAAVETIMKLKPVIINRKVINISENKEFSSPAIKIESQFNEATDTIVKLEPIIINEKVLEIVEPDFNIKAVNSSENEFVSGKVKNSQDIELDSKENSYKFVIKTENIDKEISTKEALVEETDTNNDDFEKTLKSNLSDIDLNPIKVEKFEKTELPLVCSTLTLELNKDDMKQKINEAPNLDNKLEEKDKGGDVLSLEQVHVILNTSIQNKLSTEQGLKTKLYETMTENFVKNLESRMCSFFNIKYTVTSLIHKGKFSNILKLKGPNEKELALKVICKDRDRHTLGFLKETMLKEIQKEIPKDNLNCVYLYDGFGVSGRWCLLMDYYPITLQQALKEQNKCFYIDEVRALARQLVSAVLALKVNKFVHADIKPSHIMMNSTFDQLKLCGFDSSQHIKNLHLAPNIGTISYRAPEVVLGHSIGFGIDVWAAALVIYEMATNIVLFPAKCNNQLMYQHLCTLGDIPRYMLPNCMYRTNHFVGFTFLKKNRLGTVTPVKQFIQNKKLSSPIFQQYLLHWGTTSQQNNIDSIKLYELKQLLYQMLALDPGKRLTIEAAYSSRFIFNKI